MCGRFFFVKFWSACLFVNTARHILPLQRFLVLSNRLNHNMARLKDANKPQPPADVRGMVVLDRSKFDCRFVVRIARLIPTVTPFASFSMIIDALKRQGLLLIRQFRPVQKLSEMRSRIDERDYKRLVEEHNWLPTDTVVLMGSAQQTSVSTDDRDGELTRSSPGPENDHQFEGICGSMESRRGGEPVSDSHIQLELPSVGLKVSLAVQCVSLLLGYDNFSHQDVLSAILPADQTSCTSYSLIGHVVHVNLREHNIPYGDVIGAVLLDKVPGCRTVVNKLDVIESEFRNFQLQLLAGDDDFIVNIRENGNAFRLDFSQVYWNPRLSSEHERLCSKWLNRPGDLVFDVFAGVGPFAIPAAKRGCLVLANDLNPHSHRWLAENVKINKVENLVKTFNMCGREFVEREVRARLIEELNCACDGQEEDGGVLCCHLVMNLPATAVQFVDSLNGLLSDNLTAPSFNSSALASDHVTDSQVGIKKRPRRSFKLLAHVYSFTKNLSSPGKSIIDEISRVARCDISECVLETAFVRSVAPNKDMYRVTWQVPDHMLWSTWRCENQDSKRPRVE